MFKLLISKKAEKRLKLLKHSHQEAILSALQEIKEDLLIGKPLTRELVRRYSYKLGPYRIIYMIYKKDKIVYILSAGHRSTIYH
ncbi:type II toxin-antitoxin system RelE/ParE family toxin [Candidatus Daviesbacteria bacterium]|nr:type II toxin-antitoxin system RelE/ParE family toxin [Candidatus Daviesbacteria bacterium]